MFLLEGFGGVWMGTPLTKINEEFLQQAAQALEGRKGTGVIVTCSQGLRYQSIKYC